MVVGCTDDEVDAMVVSVEITVSLHSGLLDIFLESTVTAFSIVVFFLPWYPQ